MSNGKPIEEAIREAYCKCYQKATFNILKKLLKILPKCASKKETEVLYDYLLEQNIAKKPKCRKNKDVTFLKYKYLI